MVRHYAGDSRGGVRCYVGLFFPVNALGSLPPPRFHHNIIAVATGRRNANSVHVRGSGLIAHILNPAEPQLRVTRPFSGQEEIRHADLMDGPDQRIRDGEYWLGPCLTTTLPPPG